MKDKNNDFDYIVWVLLIAGFVLLGLYGCRTKKSTLHHKQSEKENVSVVDKSQEQKTEKVQEAAASSSRESVNEKAFSEMWMSFEGDKITVTAPDGTKTEITNPRYNKSATKNTETAKDKQSVADSSKVSETEQKKQSDVKVDVDKESTSEIKKSDERKTKVVWWYFVIGVVVVLCFMFLVKNRNKLI